MRKVIYTEQDRRVEVESPLMRESLIDESIRRQTISTHERGLMPDLDVISLGGQSVIDRGAKAILPLVDEIVRCRAEHRLLVGVGGGARVRHTLHIGLSLGLPVGALANLVANVDAQNAKLMAAVFARCGGVLIEKEEFLKLPLVLAAGMIPIMSAMPPFHFWEPTVGARRVPLHAHDLGMFVLAEVTGARSMIFLKDEDGLYTNDPKKDPQARFIERISAPELLELDPPDMIVERAVVQALLTARHCRSIRIINGLKPELLGRALAGEDVGSVIVADANADAGETRPS
jgi:molybdenum storage protein